jgi:hypothetical protein
MARTTFLQFYHRRIPETYSGILDPAANTRHLTIYALTFAKGMSHRSSGFRTDPQWAIGPYFVLTVGSRECGRKSGSGNNPDH